MLSVGTGVACLAVDEIDATHRTFDGAGYLVGDEGGGFWLGRHGIRAALAAHEGRSTPTSLTSRVASELGPLDSAAVRLHGNSRAVDAIAQTAVVVLAEAEAGDPVAAAIVSDAAVRLVTTVSAALSFLSQRPDAAVALDGRLLLNDSRLRDRFLLEMENAHPSVSVFETPGSSLDGAIWLSQRATPGVYNDLVTIYRTEP
jgi:N-acetylglucosamine kinase-like BadF-type ATPase